MITRTKRLVRLFCKASFAGPMKFDFLIIGGQKCGSTALARYLSIHPSCCMARGKESLVFSSYYSRNRLIRHLRMCDSFCFDLRRKKRLRFEATPENVYYDEIPERIYKNNPNVKLIMLVREPVSRAFSAYQMGCNEACKGLRSREDPAGEYSDRLKDSAHYPFTWFIEEEMRQMEAAGTTSPSAFRYPDFLRRGMYCEQIERYMQWLKPEQLLIIEDKDLKTKKIETLRRVEQFLGISSFEWKEQKLENKNVGVYTQSFPEEYREKLRSFFAPYNELLYLKLNKRLDW